MTNALQAHEKIEGLRFVTDSGPAIRRNAIESGFEYVDPKGNPITDEDTLKRIKALVIPPAWTDVWICPKPNGHIQATGRDAKGRKQYRYHKLWHAHSHEVKFERMLLFGQKLPEMRKRVLHDLALPGLSREKVLALIVYLLETTLIRIGNKEYSKQNKSYGLTTMRDRHVAIEGWTVKFTFKGKSGVKHSIEVKDRRLAALVKSSRDLPGQQLFQYVDESGAQHDVNSSDVNDYIREISGESFSAKDFRTWHGTVLAARTLLDMGPAETQTAAKKNIVDAIKQVASHLGNTVAVSRKYYIHPMILDAYTNSTLTTALQSATDPDSMDALEAPILAMLTAAAKSATQEVQKQEKAVKKAVQAEAGTEISA